MKKFVKKNWYQPSHQEIADEFGWKSPNAVQEILMRLERAGWVRRSGQNRAVRILP
jgi:SOS-response transcriptional repressor LexA